MSRKKLRSSRKAGAPSPAPPQNPAQPRGRTAPTARARALKPWQEWTARVALMVFSPLCVALLLELGLRLGGYGYPTRFYIDDPAHGICRDNRQFVWQFYSPKTPLSPQPFRIETRKPAGTVRIFILGESAAVGTPEPSFGFARILERLLTRQYPHTRFEVVNAAIRGINSHVLLPIAKDCAELDPDLFIAYLGNNEVVGLHAPGPDGGRLTSHLRLLRVIQWLRSTRVGELFSAALARKDDPYAVDKQDMTFFRNHRLAADDSRREIVYRNFQRNLEDIGRVIANSRAALVLSTVTVNLADNPPFASLHRADLAPADRTRWETAYATGVTAERDRRFGDAIQSFEAAERLDDHFADLHFRLGRCHLATSEFDEARREFALARDWDALQFRADGRINTIIREMGHDRTAGGIRLVDAEAAFAKSPLSEHGIPGQRLFYEHAHLRFDGDYLLAVTLYPSVVAALAPKLGQPLSAPLLSRDECAAALAFTRLDEAKLSSAMIEVPTQPPFLDQLDHEERLASARQGLTNRFANFGPRDVQRAIQTYHAAIGQAPDDWQLHYNLASLYFSLHDYTAAIEQFKAARQLMPTHPLIVLGLSRALAESGKFDDAVECLQQLLREDPAYQPAQDGLAAVEAMRRRQVPHLRSLP